MAHKDVVLLYGLPKPGDEPSASGYCQKVETFLRATSTPYELREAYPNQAPKGKVPYITFNNEVVSDSHFILQYLVRSGASRDLDRALTRTQLADTRSYQTYIEELLYLCIVRERWFNDDNYAVISKEAFGAIPWLIRPIVSWYFRRRAKTALWYQGVGRHSKEEVESIITRAFEDLEERYIHGENYFHRTELPTEIDIIVYAFIANALQTYSNPFVCQQILSKPNLVKFAQLMTNKLFPEYAKLLQRLDTKI